MHHGGHVAHSLLSLGWLLPVLVLAGIAAVAALLWALRRRGPTEALSSSGQPDVEQNPEGQILAMLHQAGGSLRQTDIAANLGLPADRVAASLRELEERGSLRRQWETDHYTFTVQAAP